MLRRMAMIGARMAREQRRHRVEHDVVASSPLMHVQLQPAR